MSMHQTIVAAALALLVSACFSPTPGEGVACGADQSCPPGLECAADGICRGGGVAVDSSVDGTALDAPVDALSSDAPPTDAGDSCDNAAQCDNGLYCDGAEDCVDQQCVAGVPPTCSDSVGCTIDTCDEDADDCTFAPDHSLCSDVDKPTCDAAAGCVGQTCTTGTQCDDGVFCNGVEVCDLSGAVGLCKPGAAPTLDDGVGCTADVCNEAIDKVEHLTINSRCDNAQFCDGAETCHVTLDCQPGVVPVVDDGVGCTADSCNETTDMVDHVANNSLCDNGMYCDGAETCHATLDCQPGAAPTGDDGIGCTTDTCNETTDSFDHVATNSLCDNGLHCDGVETCSATLDCQSGTAPVCGDAFSCTVDTCDEATDSCSFAPDHSLCTDPTKPSCNAAAGCVGQTCTNSIQCDDGLYCNGAESCDLSGPVGLCQPGVAPTCADTVTCTVDICDESQDRCRYIPDNTACDNGQFCDGAETCNATLGCQSGASPAVSDGVGCTVDSCNETSDRIDHVATDSLCNNSQFCDGVETCHATLDCQSGTAPTSNDGVGCTVESCNEATNQIDHTPSNALCSNGQFCDGVETCHATLDCQSGTAPTVNDGVGCTADSCNEVTNVVDHITNDGSCSNGQFCDGVETCHATLDCQSGTAPSVSDGVGCTSDSCNEGTDSIDHVVNNAWCDNMDACDGVETCHATLDCQAGTAPNACAGIQCGDVTTACGTFDCGTAACMSPDECGGGAPGTEDPNLCGCTPQTCVDAGAECGTVSDGCSATIACMDTCSSPNVCGGGAPGMEDPIKCGCTPKTCGELGADCGFIGDGCGGMLDCGTWCAEGETCGGSPAMTPNLCGCTLETCATLNAECGWHDRGCPNSEGDEPTTYCGDCTGGQTCVFKTCQ